MMKDIAITSACLLALGACQTNGQPTAEAPEPPGPAQSAAAGSRAAPQTAGAPDPAAGRQRTALVSCQPGARLSLAFDRLVDFADPDGDGSVSRAEASSAVNFMVGGFFFRSDANGDGKVTPEEGRAARQELLERQPVLAALLQQAKQAGMKPVAQLADMLDVQYGQPVTVEEARGAGRRAVDALFSDADADHDGKVTYPEARAASWKATQAVGDNIFRAIDGNHDDKLDQDEFRRALDLPAKVAFEVADGDGNGTLTEAEARTALAQVAGRLGMQTTTRTR